MIISDDECSVTSDSLEQTQDFGEMLGKLIDDPVVIGLVGQLGSGKTFLVRSIALGLGVLDQRVVTSPTFVLVQQYEGRLTLHHFDVYRLEKPEMFDALAPEEYFESDGVSLVEWADRVRQFMPDDFLEIRMEIMGPTSRDITLTAHGSGPSRLLNLFRDQCCG